MLVTSWPPTRRYDPVAEPQRGSYIAFMSLPVVGITVDTEQPGGYSKFPWYALRENYAAAVTRAKGLPVLPMWNTSSSGSTRSSSPVAISTSTRRCSAPQYATQA